MKSYMKYIAFALFLSVAVSCADGFDELQPESVLGSEVEIPFNLNAVPMSGSLDTRSLPSDLDESAVVSDVWLLQYDKATGGILAPPRYYSIAELTGTADSPAKINVILPPSGKTNIYVAVANTSDQELFNDIVAVNTVDKLRQYSWSIPSPDSLYGLTSDGDARFILSGFDEIEGSEADPSLDFSLYRNIAKLTLTVGNSSGSGVTIKTVRLCSLPDKVFYADRLWDYSVDGGDLGDYTASPVPALNECAFVNWAIEDCEIAPGGASMTFDYYLPRNCRGVNPSQDPVAAKDKNASAPANATYIEIVAVSDVGGYPVVYRFYPGENMEKDYNILSNHHYTLPVTITQIGSSLTDSRVEDMTPVELGESNCYLINPLELSVVQPIFSMPVAKRSNRYWKTVLGLTDANAVIREEEDWIVEVIWQDQPHRLITFCDSDGRNERDTYRGTGLEETVYFKPKMADGEIYKLEGNVIIGVRKPDAGYDAYMWSWHLWITDYDPDSIDGQEWVDGVYKYPVPGGEVHRYDDGMNYNNKQLETIWARVYKDKYIMDRNLGALEEYFTDYNTDYYRCVGLHYQSGRKDPFPQYTNAALDEVVLYDINGEKICGRRAFADVPEDSDDYVYDNAEPRQASMDEAVMRPHTFFYHADPNTRLIWINPDTYSKSTIWNNPPKYETEIKNETGENVTKSLFDPCPEGWQIQQNKSWMVFKKTKDNGLEYNHGHHMAIKYSVEADMPRAFYPFGFLRNVYSTTATAKLSNGGYYWTANRSHLMWFEKGSIYPMHYSGTQSANGSGLMVRCVQEHYEKYVAPM